jgi:hypothetical protein
MQDPEYTGPLLPEMPEGLTATDLQNIKPLVYDEAEIQKALTDKNVNKDDI